MLKSRAAGYLILAAGLAAIASSTLQLDVFHRPQASVLWRTDTAMAGLFMAAGFRVLLADRDTTPAWVWLAPLALLCGMLARALGTDAFVYFGIRSIFLGVAVVGIEQAWPPIRALFETRSLRLLGRWSFSIYLWQELFYKIARLDLMPRFPYLVMALVSGVIAYHLIELPLRLLFGKLLARRAPLLTPVCEAG